MNNIKFKNELLKEIIKIKDEEIDSYIADKIKKARKPYISIKVTGIAGLQGVLVETTHILVGKSLNRVILSR